MDVTDILRSIQDKRYVNNFCLKSNCMTFFLSRQDELVDGDYTLDIGYLTVTHTVPIDVDLYKWVVKLPKL